MRKLLQALHPHVRKRVMLGLQTWWRAMST
jgi:hypothetical protein